MTQKFNANGEPLIEMVADNATHRFTLTDDNPSFVKLYVFQHFIPPFGLLDRKVIGEKLTSEQLTVLRHHAKAFACLDGNAFGPQTEYQYIDIAYANLWSNDALDDIPNLYPATASEMHVAIAGPGSPNYDYYKMTPERAEEIKSHFK